jgi:hypothetical protein
LPTSTCQATVESPELGLTMQFTLRRLFAIVISVAIFFAAGLLLTVNWRRQLAIQEDLKSQGASWVGFAPAESDFVPSVLYTKPIVEDIQHYDRFRVVELKGYSVTPQCIGRLSKLKHIDNLYFISCGLCDEDLVHLPQMEVTTLLFWNVNISDESVDTLSQISGLKKVSFKATAITPQGVEKLQSLLPWVEIVSVP